MEVSTAELMVVLSSAAAFVLSLFGLMFRWTERANKFAESAARCSDLKLALREVVGDAEAQNLYRSAMGTLGPIPDGAFVGLKAHHLRKVAASRFLDDHPGFPGWLARLVVTLRSWRSKERQDDAARE